MPDTEYDSNYKINTNTDLDDVLILRSHTILSGTNYAIPQIIFTWGNNSVGQLALNDINDRSTPTQVGNVTNWKLIETSSASIFAIDYSGKLWAWGFGPGLGLGTVVHRSIPTQLGSSADWQSVSGSKTFVGGDTPGSSHTLAIKTNGTLWAWGSNSRCQLAVSDRLLSDASSPIQIAGTNWKNAAAGGAMSYAIKTDGTLWAWGSNMRGNLGINLYQTYDTIWSSPVQINGTNWSSISSYGDIPNNYDSHTLGLKSDGTLWAWGTNDDGELGIGDRDRRSVPVKIGNDTDWKLIKSLIGVSFAIKTNGSLWGWGSDTYNISPSRSSPIQIGNLYNWNDFDCDSNQFFAIKTNGDLWGWGYNNYNQFYVNPDPSYPDQVYSPVQISTLRDWTSIKAGTIGKSVVGIKIWLDW